MNDKKQLILDVAKERFERFGVKKTTMDEIAGDAGISKKTVYEHFKSKEDLFVSLFIRETLTARKALLNQIPASLDPLGKIELLFRVAADYFQRESFWVKILKDEANLYAPFLKEKYRLQVEEGILNIISKFLEAGMEQGQIRPLDSHTVAYFLFKLFQSFSYARTASLKAGPNELSELLNLILQGIIRKS